jgi:hypothetical protein
VEHVRLMLCAVYTAGHLLGKAEMQQQQKQQQQLS